MKTQQTGFTLIELVIVIVILGILASFAVPRFADTATDARKATVNALAGSMRSAAALAKGATLARGNTGAASISVEGQTVTMVQFYPTATSTGIPVALADTTGFTHAASGSAYVFKKEGASDPDTCAVSYTAAAANSAPAITPTVTGC